VDQKKLAEARIRAMTVADLNRFVVIPHKSRFAPLGVTLLHFHDRTDEFLRSVLSGRASVGDSWRTASGTFACS